MKSLHSTVTKIGIVAFLLVAALSVNYLQAAWDAPPNNPPANNAPAPINVGTVDQIKNAGLGVNALAVFGNGLFSGISRYLNFGTTTGSAGYGFRDNGGTMQYKNSGGEWASFAGAGGGETVRLWRFDSTPGQSPGGVKSLETGSFSEYDAIVFLGESSANGTRGEDAGGGVVTVPTSLLTAKPGYYFGAATFSGDDSGYFAVAYESDTTFVVKVYRGGSLHEIWGINY